MPWKNRLKLLQPARPKIINRQIKVGILKLNRIPIFIFWKTFFKVCEIEFYSGESVFKKIAIFKKNKP